jgi:hypothetical protein
MTVSRFARRRSTISPPGRQRFDLVLFLGVFYHLRYPLLGLDLVAEHTRRLLPFQTLTMPGNEVSTHPTTRISTRARRWPRRGGRCRR